MAVTVETEPAVVFAPPTTAEHYAPLAPATMEETGLSQTLIADLALKLIYQRGPMTANDLSTVRHTVWGSGLWGRAVPPTGTR